MKKMLAMLLATVLCVMTFTGCGNDTTKNVDGTTSVVDENSSETENGKVLIVGTNAEFPPFEYVGDDGEIDGFDIALIKAIAAKMDMEVEVQNMEFDSLISAIGSKIDVAIAGMTILEERNQNVEFSDPYYEAAQYVIVMKDSELATAANDGNTSQIDLENKAIGAQLGTTGAYLIEEISGATPQLYNKGVDAVNDLINGRVEAVIIDKDPALVFQSKFPDQVVAIDGVDFGFEEKEYYGIVMPKDSELVSEINKALAEIKEDGTFDAIVEEYFQ